MTSHGTVRLEPRCTRTRDYFCFGQTGLQRFRSVAGVVWACHAQRMGPNVPKRFNKTLVSSAVAMSSPNIEAETLDLDDSVIGVDEHVMAKSAGLSVSAFRKDRYGERRIPFIRFGDRILYHPPSVRAALLSLEEGGPPAKGRKKAAA